MEACDQSMADGRDFKARALPTIPIVYTLQHGSDGVLEYWIQIPALQHSITPLLHCSILLLLQQPRQLLIEFESAPLQIEGEKFFRILKRDFMLAQKR